jgi:hypothetical protein
MGTAVFYTPASASVLLYKDFVSEVIRRDEPVSLVDLARPDSIVCTVSPADVIDFVGNKIKSTDGGCKILDYIQATSEPCHVQP